MFSPAGFSLLYRWAHGPWATARLPRGATAHTLGELRCGTEYIARLGVSDSTAEQGEGVTVKTNGSGMIPSTPMSVCLSVLLSVCLSVCLSGYLSSRAVGFSCVNGEVLSFQLQ